MSQQPLRCLGTDFSPPKLMHLLYRISLNTYKILKIFWHSPIVWVGQIENAKLSFWNRFPQKVKWLFTHPFPGSWVILACFFSTPQTRILPCLGTWLYSSGFFCISVPLGTPHALPAESQQRVSGFDSCLCPPLCYDPTGVWNLPDANHFPGFPPRPPWRVSRQCLIKHVAFAPFPELLKPFPHEWPL